MNKPTLSQIDDFFSAGSFAVVGVSRNPNKFGTMLFRDMVNYNYEVYPVNPNIDELHGHKCYRNIFELPETVQGLIMITQPEQTIQAVKEAASKGIRYIWIQPGAEHIDAHDFCNQQKINCITGECIFMHIKPVKGIHGFHRFLRRLFGTFPK